MRRRGDIDSDNTDRWLMTYADLITLLLAFFVMMYAISKIDLRKFDKMSLHLQGEFNAGDATRRDGTLTDSGAGVLKIGQLKLVAQRLQSPSFGPVKGRVNMGPSSNINPTSGFSELPADSLSQPFTVEMNERGLVIHVMESALFASGQADLGAPARETLDRIAQEIRDLPNQIRVEGHTDDRPITTSRFPSNWELSSARATAVVRYFIDAHALTPDRVSALGYGEFRPLLPNDTPENRAKNRRVDIVILTDNLSRFEPKPLIGEAANPENNLQAAAEENSGL